MRTKIRRERNQFIAFYVSEEEKEAIIRMAQSRDQSISDFCRKTLLSNVAYKEKDEGHV